MRRLAATLAALCVGLGPGGLVPAAASVDTVTLIAAPPAPWESIAGTTNVVGASGPQARAPGYVDGSSRAWRNAGQIMDVRLEHFSSTIWAAGHIGASRAAGQRNPKRDSFTNLPDYGPSAYELTLGPDSSGFRHDAGVFYRGDYMAIVDLAAQDAPDHTALIDELDREYAALPDNAGELGQIGLIFVGGALGALLLVVAIVVLIVVLVRRGQRHTPAPSGFGSATPPGLALSPDRRFWWDGQAWRDTATSVPPLAQHSPDGSHWWDGAAWRPMPPA